MNNDFKFDSVSHSDFDLLDETCHDNTKVNIKSGLNGFNADLETKKSFIGVNKKDDKVLEFSYLLNKREDKARHSATRWKLLSFRSTLKDLFLGGVL